MKYALELSTYGVQFQPRIANMAQVIANFILEFTRTDDANPNGEKPK